MAYMYLSIFDSPEEVAAPGLLLEPDSLYSAFEQVTGCFVFQACASGQRARHRKQRDPGGERLAIAGALLTRRGG